MRLAKIAMDKSTRPDESNHQPVGGLELHCQFVDDVVKDTLFVLPVGSAGDTAADRLLAEKDVFCFNASLSQ